jgi:hypothetical protein
MQIGVDAIWWAYGRYARALLTAALDLDQHNHCIFFVDGRQFLSVFDEVQRNGAPT